jgi:hypothetical protein
MDRRQVVEKFGEINLKKLLTSRRFFEIISIESLEVNKLSEEHIKNFSSMGADRRVKNQIKSMMKERDETIKVLELNADIAQSRIEELEDVQISLEQENANLLEQLAACRRLSV